MFNKTICSNARHWPLANNFQTERDTKLIFGGSMDEHRGQIKIYRKAILANNFRSASLAKLIIGGFINHELLIG